MNKVNIFLLKALRKTHEKLIGHPKISKPDCIQDPDVASELIYNLLMQDKPCMIARFGSTELVTMVNYLGVKNGKKDILGYIQGKGLPWWWNENMFLQMQNWSGFFPPTQENIERFCEMMFEDLREVDVLGSWLSEELYFEESLHVDKKIDLEILNPFFSKKPWTEALVNKTVLVIHPFSNEIQFQYLNRDLIFPQKRILPSFDLQTIKSVQSLGGHSEFSSWFDALENMKRQINDKYFDICLIGAGAYGFPLAAHVKRMNKKVVHLGGSLQLLFGIKGKRWENPNYNPKYNYSGMMNEYWIYPGDDTKPLHAESIEGACYW